MADGEGIFAGCAATASDDSAVGLAGGGAEIAGEVDAIGGAVGECEEVVGFATEVAETGFSAPSAEAGVIEMLALVFCPAAAVTEFEDPEAEAGETFE